MSDSIFDDNSKVDENNAEKDESVTNENEIINKSFIEEVNRKLAIQKTPRYLIVLLIVSYVVSMICSYFKIVGVIFPLCFIGLVVFWSIKYDLIGDVKYLVKIIKEKKKGKKYANAVVVFLTIIFIVFNMIGALIIGIYSTVYQSSPKLMARTALIKDIETEMKTKYSNYESGSSNNIKAEKDGQENVFHFTGKVYFYSVNYLETLKECYSVEINDTVKWDSGSIEYISKEHVERREESKDYHIKEASKIINEYTAVHKAEKIISDGFPAGANYKTENTYISSGYNENGSIWIKVIVNYSAYYIRDTKTVVMSYSDGEYTILYFL